MMSFMTCGIDSLRSDAISSNPNNSSPCSLNCTCFFGISCVTLIFMKTHPWAKFRRAANMTQQQVANHLNIDRLSVLRYEQGMFGHLSDELLSSLSQIFKQDEALLVMEYRGYQREQRLAFAEEHLAWRAVLKDYQGKLHPLIYYRNYYELSRNALCKGLCLDYGPVSNYEMNKQRTIPAALVQASEDIRWDYTGLESAVLEWRASGRSSLK